MPVRQAVEKRVLALERAHHRGARSLLDPASETHQEGVGEADDLRLFRGEPGGEPIQFLDLAPFLAPQGRNREIAELAGLRGARPARGEL